VDATTLGAKFWASRGITTRFEFRWLAQVTTLAPPATISACSTLSLLLASATGEATLARSRGVDPSDCMMLRTGQVIF